MAQEIKKNNNEKSDIVKLKKEEFQELLDRIKRVESAAEKSRLNKYDEQNKKEGSKQVKLRMINGKVVVSWGDMIINRVEKTPQGAWFEEQKIEVEYEDGEKETMDLVIFNRRYTYIMAEIISETRTGDDVVYKLKTEDDKDYEVNSKFIN